MGHPRPQSGEGLTHKNQSGRRQWTCSRLVIMESPGRVSLWHFHWRNEGCTKLMSTDTHGCHDPHTSLRKFRLLEWSLSIFIYSNLQHHLHPTLLLIHSSTRNVVLASAKIQCLCPQRADNLSRETLVLPRLHSQQRRGFSCCPRPTLPLVPLTPTMTLTLNIWPLPGIFANSSLLFPFSLSFLFYPFLLLGRRREKYVSIRKHKSLHPSLNLCSQWPPSNFTSPLLLQTSWNHYQYFLISSLLSLTHSSIQPNLVPMSLKYILHTAKREIYTTSNLTVSCTVKPLSLRTEVTSSAAARGRFASLSGLVFHWQMPQTWHSSNAEPRWFPAHVTPFLISKLLSLLSPLPGSQYPNTNAHECFPCGA